MLYKQDENGMIFMLRKILSALSLFAAVLCSGESVVDFSNPLESPEAVRGGVFDAAGKERAAVLFQYRPFLDHFDRGEIVLSIAPQKKLPEFTLVVRDRENRRFHFSLRKAAENAEIVTFAAVLDSCAPYSWTRGKESGRGIPEQPLRIGALDIGGLEDSIHFKSLDFFERGVICGLKTGSAVSVLNLGTSAVPELEVVNHSASAAKIDLDYSVADVAGIAVEAGRKKFLLKPGEAQSVLLKRPALQGVYTVSGSWAEGERRNRFRRRFAAMIPAKNEKEVGRDAYRLGFCEHFQRYSRLDNEKMVEYLALCGAEDVRLGWLWNQINPKPDVWNFTRVDWLVDLLMKNGIDPLAQMGAAPGYAEASGYKPTNAKGLRLPRPECYEEWLRRFAIHYNGKIRKFSVWNEPDVAHFADFDAVEYLKLQQIAHRALKSVNPDNIVIAGGFSQMLNSYSREALELMAKQAPDSADMISTHLYEPLGRFPETLADCRRFMKTLNLKQELCTEETGAGTVDDLEQIPVLFQKVIQCRAEGFTLFYWYNLRNCGFNPKDREDNFGLLEHDLNPRAGYVTFNMLAGLYGNARFVRKEAWEAVRAFRFESADSALYALWLWKKSQTDTLAIFETDAEKVELIDPFGNAKRLFPEGGRVAVPVDSVGQTLRLYPKNSGLKLFAEALVPAGSLSIRPEEEKTFSFICRGLPENVELQVLPIDGLSCLPAERESSSHFRIPVRASREFRMKEDQFFRIQILSGEKKIGAPIGFRFRVVYEVPFEKMSKVGWIGRRTQVRNMLPDTPEYGKLFWTDFRDCSVAFGATADRRGNLHFQIGMDDDVHVQNFSAEEMWKGDSIQLVIQFPGQSDYWELGVAMTGDGKLLKHIWRGPKGMDQEKALAGIRLTGKELKNGSKLHHNFYLILNLDAFGSSVAALEKDGIYFNILANDNDGEVRESQLSFMEGSGTDPATRITSDSPLLVVK